MDKGYLIAVEGVSGSGKSTLTDTLSELISVKY